MEVLSSMRRPPSASTNRRRLRTHRIRFDGSTGKCEQAAFDTHHAPGNPRLKTTLAQVAWMAARGWRLARGTRTSARSFFASRVVADPRR